MTRGVVVKLSMPVFVVSGFMRTGTSMMMRALEVGGMSAGRSQSRDDMRLRHADEHYDPNVGGLYELTPRDYKRQDFPAGYEGRVIKGLNYCVPRMAVVPSGIKVVFMRRDAEEIRQSYDAFFDKPLGNVDQIDPRMEDIIKRIRNRRDVINCDVFWYRQVVGDPVAHFQILADHGWPINVYQAAAVVDVKQYRYRREQLTVGIV